MTENHIAPSTPTPEAATDEPAFPVFTSQEAEDAFWQGVSHGIRFAGREPGHPHMPADFDLDLTRDGASSALVSSKLLDPQILPGTGRGQSEGLTEGGPSTTPLRGAVPLPGSGRIWESARSPRHDGWTRDRERLFCEALANSGVVADACRACGMSRDAA